MNFTVIFLKTGFEAGLWDNLSSYISLICRESDFLLEHIIPWNYSELDGTMLSKHSLNRLLIFLRDIPSLTCALLFPFSSVQLLSHVWLFATPWTAARQASLSVTNSRSFLKLMSVESVMPSNHLIPCCPLLLPPSIFPSIRVFSNEPAFCIRWPKYWSFSFNISPSSEHPEPISFKMDRLDLLEVQGTLKSLL